MAHRSSGSIAWPCASRHSTANASKKIEPFGAVVAILGYVSVAIAAFNLVPVEGLDGNKAWKLIKLWRAERRGRKFRPSRRR